MTAEEFNALPMTHEDQAGYDEELECEWGDWSQWDYAAENDWWISTYKATWEPACPNRE